VRGFLPLTLLLTGAALASALGVVHSAHRCRLQFADLQRLQEQQDELQVERGRLQLEQSTYANLGRVESEARRQLGMVAPAQSEVVVVYTGHDGGR